MSIDDSMVVAVGCDTKALNTALNTGALVILTVIVFCFWTTREVRCLNILFYMGFAPAPA